MAAPTTIATPHYLNLETPRIESFEAGSATVCCSSDFGTGFINDTDLLFDLQYNEEDLEEGEIPMSVPIQQRKELQANYQVQLLGILGHTRLILRMADFSQTFLMQSVRRK